MSNSAPDPLVVFTLDDHSFALSLGVVTRVVHAVEIAPLPAAPPGVRGVVNVQGKVLPVFDPRPRCGLPPRELLLSDQLIIARTQRREVALLVDAVVGVVQREAANETPATRLLPDFETIEGVMKLDGGLILVQNLNRFLTLEEETVLQTALESLPER